MQQPRNYGDFLQGEPFLSYFASYGQESSGRRTGSANIESQLKSLATDDLKMHENTLAAARAWIELAFKPSWKGDPIEARHNQESGSSQRALTAQLRGKKHPASPRRASVSAKNQVLHQTILTTRTISQPVKTQTHPDHTNGKMMKKKRRSAKQYRAGFEGETPFSNTSRPMKPEAGLFNPQSRFCQLPIAEAGATPHQERSQITSFPSYQVLSSPVNDTPRNNVGHPGDIFPSNKSTCSDLPEMRRSPERPVSALLSINDYARHDTEPQVQVDSVIQNTPISGPLSLSDVNNSPFLDASDTRCAPVTSKEIDIPVDLDSDGLTRFEHEDVKPLAVAWALPSGIPQVISACKPRLITHPPIWAQSRQEVCESFDWFRSYQGGVYHAHNVARGYLLSAFASFRDCFKDGGRFIISHGGGKAESLHSRQGLSVTAPADDQSINDKSVRALMTNYRESRPLVLLVDDKYTLFPFDLGATDVTYAILGFYTIAHVWAEYHPANNERGRVVRYKFAFQWCDGQGEPWWLLGINASLIRPSSNSLSSEPVSTSHRSSRGMPVKKREYKIQTTIPSRPNNLYFICLCCNVKTPQVYEEGWACLNASCARFWMASDGAMLTNQLNYNSHFLRSSSPHFLPPNLRDIRPTAPSELPDNNNTTYAFTRGWHCRDCGRLSCRFKWEHWECSYCKAIVGLPGKIRTAKEFWSQKIPVPFHDHYIDDTLGIIQCRPRLFFDGPMKGQIRTFILPGGRSRIHHIYSLTPQGNLAADIIFKEYQEQASSGELAFRRWPMRSHKCRGPLLTNYFSQNSGEPYHYVGGTANTVPFDEAPGAVLKACEFIRARIHQALGTSENFNEVLSCAYMERQKMAFHSDSEHGLGPLVAGLSLGAPALMHFRIHHKHHEVVDPTLRKIIMTFILRHGDILVMDGADVQECYEHTVVPTNFRIAATARRIDKGCL